MKKKEVIWMSECKCYFECPYFKEQQKRKTYRDLLNDIREKHYERLDLYDNGTINRANVSYLNGWNMVTGFVSKSIGPAKYIVGNSEREEIAIELAQNLSDLFFEYRNKAIEAASKDKKDPNGY